VGNDVGGRTRMPDDVRTRASMGNLYTFLVQQRRPNVVVEFGTAFGVSGMYFLAGLESNGAGHLMTFEPNNVWAEMARNNLSQIGDRFNLIVGTFEENIDNSLSRDQCIDMAFIDAIHAKEFVVSQLEIVIAKSSSKAIILLDDIDFSDNMSECWRAVSTDSRFSASAALGNSVGILELTRKATTAK
jgi:predicted O-methyltransferase YrrM